MTDSSKKEFTKEGCTWEQIYRGLSEWELKNIPDVWHSKDHTVMFQLPLQLDDLTAPQPHKSEHKWDSEHVRLPFSPRSQYPVENEDGTADICSRWSLICDALDKAILTPIDLQNAILSYNSKYSKSWRFRGLHKLFETMPEQRRQYFFDDILPLIISLALQLPDLIRSPIPLLKQGQTHSISFSQQQIASLVANAFLCTFPRRNSRSRNSEYVNYPDINFNRLFLHPEPHAVEKLKCILHYFERVTKNVPLGVVTIIRRVKQDSEIPCWQKSGANFKNVKLHVTADGTIEDGRGLLQVDFANKYLGGGVLGLGCVQEEIRFVLCPELFVTRLIAEYMKPNEAIFAVGCERFAKYSGYSKTFKFEGQYDDTTPWDNSKRKMCTIVAIDALKFPKPDVQFKDENMLRELKKAYVGYCPWLKTPAGGVATGNWGCGAFGGNKHLKALLQLMVCCVTSRPLVYFTFGDDGLQKDLLKLYLFLREKELTVAQVWSILIMFSTKDVKQPNELYNFIYKCYDRYQQKQQEHIDTTTAAEAPTKKSTNNFLANFASTFAAAAAAAGKQTTLCSETTTSTAQRKLWSPPPPSPSEISSTIKPDVASISSPRSNVENAQSSGGLLSQLDRCYYEENVKKSDECCDTPPPQGKIPTAAGESSSLSVRGRVTSEEKIQNKSAEKNDDDKMEVTEDDDAKVPKKSPHSKAMTQRKLFDYFK